MTSCSRLLSKQGMLKALYEIPQVLLHLSVYEMQKVLCLDMSLISRYHSMYMYILQSVQCSDHVDMLQSLQYSDHVYVHITESAILRTCICTYYKVYSTQNMWTCYKVCSSQDMYMHTLLSLKTEHVWCPAFQGIFNLSKAY